MQFLTFSFDFNAVKPSSPPGDDITVVSTMQR